MKLTEKQEQALKLVEYFVPGWVDWEKIARFNLSLPLHKYKDKKGKEKLKEMEESADGQDPIEAFFMISERGSVPEKITSFNKLSRLLWGQRWIAAHVKMWKVGRNEGVLYFEDFNNNETPDCIKNFVKKQIFI